MSTEIAFEPRAEFTINWVRQYDSGPSDAHLHAMGQFIANYSAVEWKISELFAMVLERSVKEAQRLAVETNMPMTGMIRYTKQKLLEKKDAHCDYAEDLLFTIGAFDRISPIRHKIVHWQWGLDDGEEATLSDFIKPKNPANSTATVPLEELRSCCSDLMRIFRALKLGSEVMSGRRTRQQLLEAHREPSPEKLFRP